jgi:hypothetical protein
MDRCWDLEKDNVKKIVDLTKSEAEKTARLDTQKIIESHDKRIEEELKNMDVNKMAILNAKKEAHENFLRYSRAKEDKRSAFFDGQLKLIERILNGKN